MAVGKNHFGRTACPTRGAHSYRDGLADRHGFADVDLYDAVHTTTLCEGEAAPWRDNYTQWFANTLPGVAPNATGLANNDMRGRPYVLDEALHPTAWTARRAVAAIRAHAGEGSANGANTKPLFLKASFHRPHSPYDPPQRLWDALENATLPPRVVSCDGWDARFGVPRNLTQGAPMPCPELKDNGFACFCGDPGEAELANSRRGYHANVAFVDEGVGQIMAALDETGMGDDTIVMLVADHGDMQVRHDVHAPSAYLTSDHV